MCINIVVYDVIAALPGGACLMHDVIKALPDIDRESVISAVHRLSEKGALVAKHNCFGFMYSIAPGATRPIDGRGRPRKSEQSTRRLEFSPATLRSGASGRGMSPACAAVTPAPCNVSRPCAWHAIQPDCIKYQPRT